MIVGNKNFCLMVEGEIGGREKRGLTGFTFAEQFCSIGVMGS